jgi:acyl carrier protein
LFTVLDRTNDTSDHVADDDVADRITALARRAMGKQPITKPIGHYDDLRACGLSSLGLVNLMLSVETEFDLKIPERDMTPANFRSIARIADLVRALSSQATTSGTAA